LVDLAQEAAMATTKTLGRLAALILLVSSPGLAQPARPPAKPATPPATLAPAPPPMIYRLELMRTGPLPPDAQQKLLPMHTMDEVERYLKANDVSFAWRRQDLDSTTAPPEFVRSLETLPPNEVFVTPQADGGAVIGTILSHRLRPAP
jgi:hypothetical protein